MDGLPSTPAPSDWVGRAVRAQTSLPAGVGLVVFGLAISWALTYVLGGAGHVAPHWFYAPILLAAARFGAPGALLTAAAAGVLVGPLMPLDVHTGTAQSISDWTSRAGFFAGNGLVMAVVIGRLKAALGRELDVAKAERELARHKEAVIQTVSHEFRTPLTTIHGTVRTLEQRGLVPQDARPLIESLERSTRRLDNLIRIVVAASEALIDPRQRRHEAVSVRDCCEQIAKSVVGATANRIRLSITPEAEVVVSDPDLLSVTLGAVIDNALKFSPPESPVYVQARLNLDAVEVRVRDQGPGMTEAYRGRAFQPFTQQDESATRQKDGLGIGLFAARKAVDLLGGQILLEEAAQGPGTEVVITLPQRRSGDAAAQPQPHRRESA